MSIWHDILCLSSRLALRGNWEILGGARLVVRVVMLGDRLVVCSVWLILTMSFR